MTLLTRTRWCLTPVAYIFTNAIVSLGVRLTYGLSYLRWFSNIEKQLAATEGVYFGKKMTVADLTVAHKMKFLKDGALDGIPTTIADSYPNLNALYYNVVKQPKIAAFIAKHVK
eukprot:jgi/Undpi1/6254/HiC_scaffold_20.g08738.m1